MGTKTFWQRVRANARDIAPSDPHSGRARKQLVLSLFSQKGTLAVGAVNGVFATAAAAFLSREPALYAALAVITTIAVLRVASNLVIKPSERTGSISRLELAYEAGAFSYATALGVTAALTVWLELHGGIQLLVVANALLFGVGICTSNAGRPVIALGQLSLVIVPIMVAALAVGGLAYVLLAFNLLLMLPAMASVTMNIFRTLRDSISAAETSAAMATEMRELARKDPVTGLANRTALDEDLPEMLGRLGEGDCLALLWLDLDRFKEVNDLLGHPTGDGVLAEVADRLRALVGPDALVVRFGGDEFIVATPIEDRLGSECLASEIHAEIMRPMRIDGDCLEVGVSIGVTLRGEDGDNADTLLKNADLALYDAKVNGRKQTCFYLPSMSRNLVRRREIEAELRTAIQNDQLSIFFQPIVDLASGRIRTFEALVRWFHPEKGELLPEEFIPVAEETGVLVTLGNWVTSRAARTAAKWPEDVTLAVNLSPMQIRAPGATLGVLNAIREAGIAPSRLELEVTESLFMDDHEETDFFIRELSRHGVRFALDDFGIGYSSLGHFHKYPFRKIKVDRSFVSGPNAGEKSDAIIRAVAEMGSRLDMEIVAEGLETVEQVQAVRAAGCTLGQGFYFSRAVPDHLASMLLAREREEDDGAPYTVTG